MMWTLPRYNPGALDACSRPDATGVCAPARKLPYGSLPRLLMLWLDAECARCAEHPQTPLERQYAFADYLLALRFEHPSTPALAEQADRLLGCRFHFGDRAIPVAGGSTPGARDEAGASLPAIARFRTGQVDLNEGLRGEMAQRQFELCTDTLCAVQHCAFELDVYLWTRCDHARTPHGAPPASSRLALYQALADHPEPWPSPAALYTFEHHLDTAREKLRRLRCEAHPLAYEDPF